MEESYIRGVNQELIRTLKKLVEATENQQQAIIDKLTEVSAAITGKLDTVITNQHEISITADTINLNTDTVEAKLDEVKASIEAMSTTTSAGLDTIHADITTLDSVVDTINENVNDVKSSVESVNQNTDTLETLIGDTNDKLDTAQTSLNSINGAAQYLNGIGTGVTTIASHIPNMDTNGDLIAAHSLNTANWVQVLGENTPYLNPTHLAVVAEGDTTFDNNVVLCNITDNNITVSVTAADDTTAQSVVLTPGWNPVIVKAITGATANTLIYGY